MKIPPLLLLAGISFFGMALPNHAESKPAAAPGDPFVKKADQPEIKEGAAPWRNCLFVLEVYSLEKSEAFALLESELGSAARYRHVTNLAKAGKAKLATLTALTTLPDNRCVVKAVDNVAYFDNFAPPQSKDAHAAPTSLIRRDVGDTLEVEPVLGSDGTTCDVTLAANHSSLLGFREDPPTETSSPTSLPVFSSNKATLNAKFRTNEPTFLYSFPLPTSEGAESKSGGQMCLAFARVNVPGPTAEEMKPPAKKDEGGDRQNLSYSIYSLDRAAAQEVLIAMPGINAPWEKLQKFLGEKKASLEQYASTKFKSGTKWAIQAETEVLRPAEYTSPARPTTEEKTSRTTKSARSSSDKKAKPEESDRKADEITETTTASRGIPNLDALPGVPTDFYMKPTGLMIEADPQVEDDGLSILLVHAPRNMEFAPLKATGLAASYPVVPVFTEQVLSTQQMLLKGHHMLVGTFNPPGANGVNDRADTGRTWLLFVRATPDEP